MTAQRTKKEIVYDDQIAPLMTQVLMLCQKHGISTLCAFDISGKEEPGLVVTSQLPDETGHYSKLIEIEHRFKKGIPDKLDRPNPGASRFEDL